MEPAPQNAWQPLVGQVVKLQEPITLFDDEHLDINVCGVLMKRWEIGMAVDDYWYALVAWPNEGGMRYVAVGRSEIEPA